jgi:hypothetical protein
MEFAFQCFINRESRHLQRHADIQRLTALELIFIQGPQYGLFNLALGVDADFFKELANIHVEVVFIHDIAPCTMVNRT